ncbi:MAG: alpha/beta fold hydrolase [Ectothiorhodospiraceae bacterium]|nr:alpha/beta fold hydrolase [Ectothiorhodospiraceae bacterium]
MHVEWTSYLPKPGCFEAVLENRRRACAVRRAIGLAPGEVHVADGDGGPMVFWSCAFDSEEAQARDLQARADSAEFEAVRARMRTLIDRFERRVLRAVGSNAGAIRERSIAGVAIRPREVTFESDGTALVGYLYLPPGDGPFPCLVTNHGSTINQGTTDVCRPGVAALLMSWGIASFLPHRRGYGNSPGVPWREAVGAEFGTPEYDAGLAARLDDESRDVVAALDHVSALPEIDAEHVGVIGSSFGGTVTLLAAARCPRFRCAVEFAGAAMNWERTPRLRETMLAAAAALTQPIFFAQAANDYSVRPTIELAASLEGSGKVVESKVYPDFGLTRDEGHFLYGNGGVVWGPDVRRFLERWL